MGGFFPFPSKQTGSVPEPASSITGRATGSSAAMGRSVPGESVQLRPRLSRRERQTLLYTAAGKNRVQIARLLHVERTTVRTYQDRFTAKLGGVNAQHAASRALLLGEFKKVATLDAAARRER